MWNAKVICAFAVLILVLSALLVQPSQADTNSRSEANAKDKLPAFLSDVLGINLTSYNVTNEGYGVSYPSEYGGQVKEEHYSFTLKANNSQITVGSMFDNGFISWLHLNPVDGAVIYENQPSNDALIETNAILERYQVFAENYGINASQVPQAISLIDKAPNSPMNGDPLNFNHISDFTPANITLGNMKMSVATTGIGWRYNMEGVDTSNKGMGISYNYGTLIFHDIWNLFSIGYLSVLSEEEATSLMFEATKKYCETLQIGTSNGPVSVDPEWSSRIDVGVDMIPGQLHNNRLNSILLSNDTGVIVGNTTRNPIALYPMWQAIFYFNHTISGIVGIQVLMWEDTKEIVYCTTYGYMGGSLIPSTPTPEITSNFTATPASNPESSPSETPQPTKFPSTIWIFGVLATIFALAAATLLIKRKALFTSQPLMV